MSRIIDIIAQHGVARWFINFVSILLLAGGVIVLDARSAERAETTADQQYESRLDFCEQVEEVRTYIREAILRSRQTLPTLAYYKEHPDELEIAFQNLDVDFKAVNPPLDCTQFARELTEGETK